MTTLEDFYDRYYRLVYYVCRKYTNNTEELEDLIQDIFLKIFNKIETINCSKATSSWVYRITYNSCLDFLSKKTTHSKKLQNFGFQLETDTNFEYREESGINVRLLLEKLPAEQQEIMSLVYFEGLNHEEIGKLLGYERSYITKKIKRAKEIMSKKWLGNLVTIFTIVCTVSQ